MNIFRNNLVRRLRYVSLAGVVALGLMAIIATGGGGGGGGGVAPLAYSGITAQATVNDTNAEALSTGAYSGGHAGAAMGLAAAVQPGEVGRPRTLKASQALEQAIRRIDVRSALTSASARAVFTDSGTLYGSCGGTASYSISGDDVTWTFSGQLNFNGYCEEGVILSGSTTISGLADPVMRAPVQFTVVFSFLSVTAAGDSFAMSGSIFYDFLAIPAVVNIEALFRENSTMKVYWINNFNLTLEVVHGATDYVEFTMSGRFYDPDYGWVAVSTLTPFRISEGKEWPFQGVLVVEGLPDPLVPPGPTAARLTASGPPFEYVVECEYGDNGAYDDFTIGPLPWS
jgi:hypothetical protein